MRLHQLLGAALFGLALAAPAQAQLFGRPPADIPGAPTYVQQGDAAGLTVRLERLESQVRSLTGQVEQLQNQNRRLEEMLKRFQQDVEFRFQEQSGGKRPAPAPAAPAPGRRSDAGAPGGPVVVPGGEPTVLAAPAQPAPQINPSIRVDPGTLGPFAGRAAEAPRPAAGRRGDAFDPGANPDAPGAPRPIGATPPSAPLQTSRAPATPEPSGVLDEDEDVGPSGPLDLSNPRPRPAGAAGGEPRVIAAPGGAPPSGQSGPALSPYDQAMADYRAGRYEAAEQGFRLFVEHSPRDRRVADAIYLRGETYLQRGQNADAAAQYLNVATNYGSSQRAPDALVKLGITLVGMGEKEQACATFAEVRRKHPGASAAIRSADREISRNRC